MKLNINRRGRLYKTGLVKAICNLELVKSKNSLSIYHDGPNAHFSVSASEFS